MNNEIEKILDEFKVDNKKIPFAFFRYRGKSKTYITYMEIENNPLLCGDDAPIYSAYVGKWFYMDRR